MTEHPPLLSVALLEALAERWRGAGMPIAKRLRPGLSEEEIDECVRPLGLQLPYEARVWWGWHDGVGTESGDLDAGHRHMTPAFQFLALAEAIELYRRMRAIAQGLADDIGRDRPELASVDHWWRQSLFPITKSGGIVVCDCSVAGRRPTPVRWIEPSALHEGTPPPRTASLGEVVSVWIAAWDREFWTYLPDERRFVVRWERVPADGRRVLI